MLQSSQLLASLFRVSAVAHSRGRITTEVYIDNLLAHLGSTFHPSRDENTRKNKMLLDAMSMSIQSCMIEPDFVVIKGSRQSCLEFFDEVRLGLVNMLQNKPRSLHRI